MPRSELCSGDSSGHEDRHHSPLHAVCSCKNETVTEEFIPTVPRAVSGQGGLLGELAAEVSPSKSRQRPERLGAEMRGVVSTRSGQW